MTFHRQKLQLSESLTIQRAGGRRDNTPTVESNMTNPTVNISSSHYTRVVVAVSELAVIPTNYERKSLNFPPLCVILMSRRGVTGIPYIYSQYHHLTLQPAVSEHQSHQHWKYHEIRPLLYYLL